MRKGVGVALVTIGAGTLVAASVPWMLIRLTPPRRYHYYYIAPEMSGWMSWLRVFGVGFLLVGGWLLLRIRTSDRQQRR